MDIRGSLVFPLLNPSAVHEQLYYLLGQFYEGKDEMYLEYIFTDICYQPRNCRSWISLTTYYIDKVIIIIIIITYMYMYILYLYLYEPLFLVLL